MTLISPAHPLFLIRHGETDWNVEGRLQGGRDIPLNEAGRAQAKEAAGRLRDLGLDLSAFAFICSPMDRARQTMRIMRTALGLADDGYEIVETLREITFGSWEGLTWREVRRTDPERARFRERDKWGYVPPGGESYALLCQRIAPWLRSVDRPAIVVSHGGVARAILALTGAEAPQDAASADIWQGKILSIAGSTYKWL